MDLIKKAFQVWHDDMMSADPNSGYTMDTLPVIYANSPSEAKGLSQEPYDWDLDGETPNYVHLKARRAKWDDKVAYTDIDQVLQFTTRGNAERILAEISRIKTRIEAVEQFPKGALFLIQNGFVGNSVLWWALNSNGYTTDIEKAQSYTRAEVLKRFVSGREEDVIWEYSHVKKHIKKHVDSQYLSHEYRA